MESDILTAKQRLVKLEQSVVYIKHIVVFIADKIFDYNIKFA